jgi:NADPH:quinone reductase-like Zn-dependent oxidoreductase
VWTLVVPRSDVTAPSLREDPDPSPGPGEALLRVDRVGLTTNNATYAALGESFRYWDFFPGPAGSGIVPLWGFATVVASRADGVAEGTEVYGYLPSASHLLVRPARVDGRGFRDGAPHRAELPSVYNAYAATAVDPMHTPATADLEILYRPLFLTSFVLADQLVADGVAGTTVVVSSASSRTAHGTAFLLRGSGASVLGLTSPGNLDYTADLGAYDAVLPYGAEDQVPAPAVHVDVAGSGAVTGRLRAALGDGLVREWIVGMAAQAPGARPSERTALFFAPDRIRTLTGTWGREGFEARALDAWQRFLPTVPDRLSVADGPAGLLASWTALVTEPVLPGVGRIVRF